MEPKILNLVDWRRASEKELAQFYLKRPEPGKARGSHLVVRTQLRPIDMYCYLRARFGEPNGMMTATRSDDSDNLFHWDYQLRCGDIDMNISSTSRDLHFNVTEKLKDVHWGLLIRALKQDFGVFGRQKGEVQSTLEKWVVFQNKYVSLANICADLHSEILDSGNIDSVVRKIRQQRRSKPYAKWLDVLSKRADSVYANCMKLKLLTPVMAESYINLIILILCKPEIRADKHAYDTFVRSKLPDKLAALSVNCLGFRQPVNLRAEPYSSFKRVMDKRNFAIHGNMDPVREQIEVVYFNEKMPIFVDNGDHILNFFTQQEAIAAPEQTVKDYEAVHLFLAELGECMIPGIKAQVQILSEDPFPGFDINRRRIGKLFPPFNINTMFERMKYDDDLKVSWD